MMSIMIGVMHDLIKIPHSINGGIFCQVDITNNVGKGWVNIIGGNHWWMGALPSFINILIIINLKVSLRLNISKAIDKINMCDLTAWVRKYLMDVSIL